jgi:hypothetical protein
VIHGDPQPCQHLIEQVAMLRGRRTHGALSCLVPRAPS